MTSPSQRIEDLVATLESAGVQSVVDPAVRESRLLAAGLKHLAGRVGARRPLPVRACWSRVRYRQHFRPAAALRELRHADGRREQELTVDLGQIASAEELERELCQVLDGPLRAPGVDIGPFVPSSGSPIWLFNAAFWRCLPRFMQAVGRDFRDSIAGSPDTDRKLTGEDARRCIARLRAARRRGRRDSLAYLDVGAAGTEHAAAVVGHLAAVRLGPVEYLLGDISTTALQRARQRLGVRRGQVTMRYVRLDLQQPCAALARYRGRILTAHLTNVLDNLPGEQLAQVDGRHYLLHTQLYLPAAELQRLATAYGLEPERLARDLGTVAANGLDPFLDAYREARPNPADDRRLMLLWQDLYGNPSDRRTGLRLRERLVEIPDLGGFAPWPATDPATERVPRPGALLQEVLAEHGSYSWLHTSEGAIYGCLQLLALLHPAGALEITDILLREPVSHYAAYRGPAKFDGSVVEWFNGALFREFVRRAYPDCRFRSTPLAAAGKPHMTRLEVCRGAA